MSKILKNTTGTAIELPRLGITVPASGQEEIKTEEFLDAATDDALSEITAFLNSGDIVVNDGINDLSATYGLYHLLYTDWAFNQRFLSEPERTNGFVSKTSQEAIEESRSSFNGKGFQTTFLGNGTVKNQWLENEDSDIHSNESPDVFKYKSKLVGMEYTNNSPDSDPIIIICISNLNSGSTLDRFYKWTITNSRTSIKVNQNSGFTVNAGDKMGIYIKDGGGDAFDIVVSMDFIVTDASTINISRNYSGDFDSSTIPAVGTIPEVLQ